MAEPNLYNFSFTSGSLMPVEMRLLAESYFRLKQWDAVQKECGTGQLLSFRTLATCRKFGAVLISRLKEFTKEELEYFISANAEESKLLSWVAICRRYTFIRDFMAEVVREHYLIGTPEITYTDYASFVSVKSQFHPELANLSEKTSAKIRQMLFNMMAEVGIVEQKTHIVPTLLPPALLNLLPREDTLSFPMFVREN